jgi:hypothetical protein
MVDDLMNIQFNILLFTRFEINFQESKSWSVTKPGKRFEVPNFGFSNDRSTWRPKKIPDSSLSLSGNFWNT